MLLGYRAVLAPTFWSRAVRPVFGAWVVYASLVVAVLGLVRFSSWGAGT